MAVEMSKGKILFRRLIWWVNQINRCVWYSQKPPMTSKFGAAVSKIFLGCSIWFLMNGYHIFCEIYLYHDPK